MDSDDGRNNRWVPFVGGSRIYPTLTNILDAEWQRNAGGRRHIPSSARANGDTTHPPPDDDAPSSSGAIKRRKFFIGFRKLLEWTEQKSGEVILLELISKQDMFADLLTTNLDQDWIVMIINVLAKVFGLPFLENSIGIMSIALNHCFVMQVQKYMAMMQFENYYTKPFNKFFWKNPEEFFVNLAIVCESLMDTIPTMACEYLPTLLTIVSDLLLKFEFLHRVHIKDSTISKFKHLTEKLALCQEELKNKVVPKQNYDEETPPDNFRTLSIYPTCEEILSGNPAFIRKNIIEGAYKSVEHYLDVQFRLLKEDFVAPLREGIAEYFEQQSGEKKTKKFSSSVRIHEKVIFVTPCFINDHVGVSMKFMVNDPTKMFNANSNRFTYGSLVCFTKDNFATILFGKILEKDVKNFQLVVEFQPEHNTYELNIPYMMLECKIYFEPYYHVLTALQCISESEFPMKNYLIDANSEVVPPDYLKQSTVFTIYNKRVQMLSSLWPDEKEFSLNSTQNSAFRAALTQKLAIIQGPPGTGKTYLGLEIVKTLLHQDNIDHWYNRTPILVVCYTNHALDQFLEGLVPVTRRIVRVGGQCKSERLQQYQLSNIRKNFNRDIRRFFIGDALHLCRQELQEVLTEIKYCSEQIRRIDKYDSILSFEYFLHIDDKYFGSWFHRTGKEGLLTWLLEGSEIHNISPILYSAKLESVNYHQVDSDDYDREEDKGRWRVALEDNFNIRTRKELENFIKVEDFERGVMRMQERLKNKNPRSKQSKNCKTVTDSFNLLHYLQACLKQGQLMAPSGKPVNVDYTYPNNMQSEDRWHLYFYWLRAYREHLVNEVVLLQRKHHKMYKRYTEIRNISDTDIMKEMLVVGMTTTAAARLQTTLQALECRIVVVEEAAEVLESHVAVSLTSHCQHLILIGDHQQLRPTTANYRMEKKFNLGISMFERMVRNKIQTNVLGVQHRMRPEIASLIVPSIYPELINHPSVEHFPPVVGVDSNLFFIHHTHPETKSNDDSNANLHEAKFLINLARYLIQNGHNPQDITILCAYSDVRIAVLDNYQGEESKIILLSLVRNNEEGKIGFLKLQNRVCVALSRAKEGLYMMGNMDLLCKNSEIWPKIRETLERQGSLGSHLTVRCQIHPDQLTLLSEPQDFYKVSEGGCNQICGTLMNCAHNCTMMCHVFDREHVTTRCKAPCSRILCNAGHVCPKMCFEYCGDCSIPEIRELKCGHKSELPCHVNLEDYECQVLVTATLECGHEVTNKPCHKNAKYWKCTFPCDTRVEPCGHSCTNTCHVTDDPNHFNYKCYKKCERNPKGCLNSTHKCPKTCYEPCPSCEIVVNKKLPDCDHFVSVKCRDSVDEVQCLKQCQKKIDSCGHNCKRRCYEPCGGCIKMVSKIIPLCGHEVLAKCNEEPNRNNCGGACPQIFECGHTCKAKCMDPCTTQCEELVDHSMPTFCGHKFKIACHLAKQQLPMYSISLLKFCAQPCTQMLSCGHPCSGTCGECAQGRIHATCQEKCGQILICGHECTTPCRDVCQPCQRVCLLQCSHNKCKKKCGSPCTVCREPCGRRCMHSRCTVSCGEMCTVPPCEEPCPELLKCGHPCVGFCGDPCPPLCRICDREELTDIFFGNEDDEDARFVILDECKHVVESKGMEIFSKQDGEVRAAIKYRRCPKCRTPLASTLRYSNYIKEAIQDVIKIKEKTAGSFHEHVKKQAELADKLNSIKEIRSRCWMWRKSHGLTSFIAQCEAHLEPIRRGRCQPIDLILGKTLEAKMTIVQNIGETLEAQDLFFFISDVLSEAQDYFEFLLKKLTASIDRITRQEIEDFEREQARVQRIAQFLYIVTHSSSTDYGEIREMIYRPIVFNESFDAEVKTALDEFLQKNFVSGSITEKERREIVKAVGVRRGAWYKCSNGHYFAIGDCGGAMQISNCFECGEKVGGMNHSLVSGNQHAGEMDGAPTAAWPTTAFDMRNYYFTD